MNCDVHEFARKIDLQGWAITPPVIDRGTVELLRAELGALVANGRGGARNLLQTRGARELAKSAQIRSLAEAVLDSSCFAVRALLFDKTSAANWKVVWHQDLTIAAREQHDVPGFGPWTTKAGVAHVQPPVEFLERMLAIRVHLDPCRATNGPVRVINGSHRLGRLSGADIDRARKTGVETECLVDEGAVLAFRPLILHASAPALTPNHRRVIHIEFAASELPLPLRWHDEVA